jgi:hypothetical protein
LFIGYQVDFRLQDDITNADLGPKKKEAVDEYSLGLSSCTVDDIIEDNDQEIYYCNGHDNSDYSTITNKFNNSKVWDLNTTATFDAKNNILKISGNFTGLK